MSNSLKLTIPIPPSINNDYMKPRAIMTHGKPMAMLYESKVAKDFKKSIVDMVKKEIKLQNFKTQLDKYTRIEWTWYFARVNQDTNNYYKCMIDALTECDMLIWRDDNISANNDKRIYYDSSNPRVELNIYYEDWIGVFDNIELYNQFVFDNCNQCKRGLKGNCSIHSKALENKIQEEIDIVNLTCSKKK